MWITYNLNLLLSTMYTLTGIFNGKNVTSTGQKELTMISETVGKVVKIQQVVSVFTFSSRDVAAANAIAQNTFPDDFLFGVATSAYKVEGAYNIDGKGVSIWDIYTHLQPSRIIDGNNGDIAADFYHKYKGDVELVKELGANAYRISLSWSRILPTGLGNQINYEGVKFYNNVINEMISKRITPVITMHDDDLPYDLNLMGGWTNPDIIGWFSNYARLVFRFFGDRVKHWITINEPRNMCLTGYGGEGAPGVSLSGIADYKCSHQALLAHAAVFQLYNEEFRPSQNGQVGITLRLDWYEPTNYESEADMEAARRRFVFENEWFLHPLVSGDYPTMMKDIIKEKSERAGFDNSRLPALTEQEVESIKDSLDFLGVNYYSSHKVSSPDDRKSETNDTSHRVSFEFDVDAVLLDEEKKTKNDPQGLELMLQVFNKKYILPKIYITENGYLDDGVLRDVERASYHHDHISQLLKAMKEGVDIRGYFAWSLLDNFEWHNGYTTRFGLYHVDFNDSQRPRTPKLSVNLIKEIYSTRKIPLKSSPQNPE